ncbi:MAG: sulfur-oxidizing protein SoxY [Alphaproteobacteria bacterium]|jgi:sulfur-oxidizing protein SoxY|nr:sulfur-oxidizing protein SoxY [Alphaproteobacteria bacterium]
MMIDDRTPATRRGFLIGSLAGGLVAVLPASEARATPAAMAAAIKKVVGTAPLRKGKVTLDLPPIVENGNTVSVDVSVESPMTVDNHVKAIHVFNEKNPQPNVISARLGPRAGQARVATRMRLADSQRVIAIAEMSDGTFWSDEIEVIVTIAACLEDPG